MQTALPASSVTIVSRTNTFVLSLTEYIHPEWQWRGSLFLERLLEFQLVRQSNTFIKRERARQNFHLPTPQFKLIWVYDTLLLWVRCGCPYREKTIKYLLSSLSLPLCAWVICVFPSTASSLPLDTSYILCSCIAPWSYRWWTKPHQLSQNCAIQTLALGVGWVGFLGDKGCVHPAIYSVVNAGDYLYGSQGGHSALEQIGCIPSGWASLWALGLPKHRVHQLLPGPDWSDKGHL